MANALAVEEVRYDTYKEMLAAVNEKLGSGQYTYLGYTEVYRNGETKWFSMMNGSRSFGRAENKDPKFTTGYWYCLRKDS